MSYFFSGSDVVEVGIQIEKNGWDFYSTLAKQLKNEETRKLFSYLAGEEKKHIAAFQGLQEKLTSEEPPEDFTEEYSQYIKTLADDHVFTKKDMGVKTAAKLNNEKEAIEMAMGFEKDSILLFEQMKKVVKEHNYTVIDSLIKQEQGHFMQLADIKSKL